MRGGAALNAISQPWIDRFLETLAIVRREGDHLRFSRDRVFGEPVTPQRMENLERAPEDAERLEAFVSRFGRMQDTIGNKLLPRWLRAQAEEPGTLIEVLNRAEHLGVIDSAEDWLVARELRNRLVHEYMNDPHAFAGDLQEAPGYATMLLHVHDRVRDFAAQRMAIAGQQLPQPLLE